MNTNGVSGASSSGGGTANSTGSGSSVDSMFMQLLITQLKNQDPLSPMDPSTFVQQLTQVTSLDQLTQINQLLQNALGTQSNTNTPSGGH